MPDELTTALRDTATTDAEPAGARARLAVRAGDTGLLDVAYAVVDSPLGPLLAAATPRGLVTLGYGADERLDALLGRLADRVSPRVLEAPARLDGPRRELDEYFGGRRRTFDLAVDLALVPTPFGRRVLETAREIPFGATRSYREVAELAGSPRAARAAGNALGANPVPIVVPCHRVLHSAGGIGGYTGGLDRKRRLLALEGLDRPAAGGSPRGVG